MAASYVKEAGCGGTGDGSSFQIWNEEPVPCSNPGKRKFPLFSPVSLLKKELVNWCGWYIMTILEAANIGKYYYEYVSLEMRNMDRREHEVSY